MRNDTIIIMTEKGWNSEYGAGGALNIAEYGVRRAEYRLIG